MKNFQVYQFAQVITSSLSFSVNLIREPHSIPQGSIGFPMTLLTLDIGLLRTSLPFLWYKVHLFYSPFSFNFTFGKPLRTLYPVFTHSTLTPTLINVIKSRATSKPRVGFLVLYSNFTKFTPLLY